VDVPRDGSYSINARVGSALPGRTFHIEIGGVDLTGPLAVPRVGGWDTYQSVSASIHLQAGRQVLRVVVGPEDWMDFQSLEITEGSATGPFGGVPRIVPGRVEAENYDLGGQGGAISTPRRATNKGARSIAATMSTSRRRAAATRSAG
jgi:hypothetical protein